MGWLDGNKRKELSDSHAELRESLGGKNAQPYGGFNNRAEELREGSRDDLKKESYENADKIIEEEEEATEKARNRKPVSSDDGAGIAEEVVDKPWWKR
jgi:hypothetical protein